MVIIDFKEKMFDSYARFFTSVCSVFFGYNFLSAGLKALFIVLFLFNANIFEAKAANNASFLIDSAYDANARIAITATNRVTGINAYFYTEDAYWNNLSPAEQAAALQNINALASEFDNAIYPKMRDAYGSEWNPGIDNDPRIYILLTNIVKDAGGYFNPNDEYYKTQVKDGRSNEKEIIYLNSEFIGKPSLKSFLAHEFQHMINWHQKKKISGVDEDIWLNEALSEYSSTLLGYDIPYPGSVIELRVNTFLQYTPDSLTEWQNINQDYASANLFMQFLTDQYGKNIIRAIVGSKKAGIAAIDDSLQSLNYNIGFSDVFSNWQIANYLNDKKIDNGKYAYASPVLQYYNFHVKPTETFVVRSSTPIKNVEYAKDWSGRWYEFTSPLAGDQRSRALKLVFSADNSSSNFKVPYIIKNIDGTTVVGAMHLDSSQSGTVLFNNFNTKIASVLVLPISEGKTADFTQSESLLKFSYSVSLAETDAPIISNISPNSSPLEGGTLATIIGENFSANSIVKFGGISAEIQIPDSKTIIAKIPPSSKSGSVSVEVINPATPSAAASQNFIYLSLLKDGSLIRAEGDYKVYVINGKYKRWIQSAEIFKFYPHFGWQAVIAVSPQTRDHYLNSYLIRAAGDYKVYEVNTDNSKHHLAISAAQFAASGREWDMVFVINNAERNFYKTGSTITK